MAALQYNLLFFSSSAIVQAAASNLSRRARPEETPEVLEDPPRHVRFDRRCPTRLSHRKLSASSRMLHLPCRAPLLLGLLLELFDRLRGEVPYQQLRHARSLMTQCYHNDSIRLVGKKTKRTVLSVRV